MIAFVVPNKIAITPSFVLLLVVGNKLVSQTDNPLFAEPEFNQAEAQVSLDFLRPHPSGLTTERATLKAENVSAKECDLLMVMARQDDVGFFAASEALNQLLNFVGISVIPLLVSNYSECRTMSY